MNSLLLNFFDDFGEHVLGVLSFIPKFLYMIIALIGSLVDLCQLALRKIAGVDPIFINNNAGTGDPAYRILIDALFGEGNPYPAIRTLFWGFIILGILMLLVTAFISLLQAEFALDRQKVEKKMNNTKFYTILSIVKALFALLIVPVASLFGMFLSTGLLQSIDQLTANSGYSIGSDEVDYRKYFKSYGNAPSGGGLLGGLISSSELKQSKDVYAAFTVFGTDIPTTATPISGLIFKSSAYGCNRIRLYSNYYADVIVNTKDSGGKTTNLGFLDDVGSAEVAANLLDLGFSINAKLENPVDLNDDIPAKYYTDYTIDAAFFHGVSTVRTLDRYNASLVFYYYNLWDFNYIVGFLAVFTIAKTFYSFTLVLMQRLFEVLALFLISPLATGMYPIDNGEALGKWRKKFIPKFIMIMVMIGLINLIFPIMSIFQTIEFVGHKMVDTLIQTFMLIAVVTGIERLQKAIGDLFGAKEDLSDLSDRSSKITKGFTTGLSSTFKGVKAAALPLKMVGKPLGMLAAKGGKSLSAWANNSDSKFARGLRGIGRGFKATGKVFNAMGFDLKSAKTVGKFAADIGSQFGLKIPQPEEKKLTEEEKKKLAEQKAASNKRLLRDKALNANDQRNKLNKYKTELTNLEAERTKADDKLKNTTAALTEAKNTRLKAENDFNKYFEQRLDRMEENGDFAVTDYDRLHGIYTTAQKRASESEHIRQSILDNARTTLDTTGKRKDTIAEAYVRSINDLNTANNEHTQAQEEYDSLNRQVTKKSSQVQKTQESYVKKKESYKNTRKKINKSK